MGRLLAVPRPLWFAPRNLSRAQCHTHKLSDLTVFGSRSRRTSYWCVPLPFAARIAGAQRIGSNPSNNAADHEQGGPLQARAVAIHANIHPTLPVVWLVCPDSGF